MTQQMPTKRRTKPLQVQKIVKVHPNALAFWSNQRPSETVLFNRLSIFSWVFYVLLRLSYTAKLCHWESNRQSTGAGVLIRNLKSWKKHYHSKLLVSVASEPFWTVLKTRTSRACSANVWHTSIDTERVNTENSRHMHTYAFSWNSKDTFPNWIACKLRHGHGLTCSTLKTIPNDIQTL